MRARAKPITVALDASGPAVRRILQDFEVVGLSVVSPLFPTRRMADRYLADRLAEMPASARPQDRACLCCSATFRSDGRNHRLCRECRHKDAGPVAMGWARPQRRGDGAAQ